MKTTTSQKTKIGLFTVAGILVLLIGIFLIGKKKNLFGDTFHVYGTFNNVGGLQEGNNILFSGINVGTVDQISIVSDTLIRVDMTMKSMIKPFLKSNSIATIGSDGLMGDKLITIVPGSQNNKLLSNGGRILTINPVNFDKSIKKLMKVADNAELLSAQLADITVQINAGKGSLGRLLYRDDLSKGLEGTVKNAQNITGSMAAIAGDIKSGKGSIGRMLYSDTLAKSLEGTAANAKITMSTINDAALGFSENMKALQGNFLFKGYFKKKAKADEKAAAAQSSLDSSELSDADLAEIEAAAEKAHQTIMERKKNVKLNK